jgi:hypothetical protein
MEMKSKRRRKMKRKWRVADGDEEVANGMERDVQGSKRGSGGE